MGSRILSILKTTEFVGCSEIDVNNAVINGLL